jgi:micrococcal nuclease
LPNPILPCALALIICGVACAQDDALAQYLSPSHSIPDCQLQPGGESTIVAVAGPQMLRLADGRFVRLAEIFVPAPVPAGFDPSAAATAFLRQSALGRKAEVKFGGTQRDRYGIYAGHVYVTGEPTLWLQEGLVRSGFATVAPQPNEHTCARPLLVAEDAARQARSGHWGRSYFKVLKANDPRSIHNLAGTYQIVEGTTDYASESGGRLTLHFGTANRLALTAAIEPTAKKVFADKQAPENWAKLTLRLRGWVEKKKGPSIRVSLPEQIELISRNPAASAQAEHTLQ